MSASTGGAGGKKYGSRKKESILNLDKHINQAIQVKFQGGREVRGILKGYDLMVNLVLDETVETLRDPDDPETLSDDTRKLGLSVCRGTAVMSIAPVEGIEEIANPFQ